MIGIVGKGNFSKLIQGIFLKKEIPFLIYDYKDSKKKLNELLNCKFIILAIPVQYIEGFLINITDQILIDICSVKEYPKELYLKNNIKAILTHPMFGPNSVKKLGLMNQKIMVDFSLSDNKIKRKVLKFLDYLELKSFEMDSLEHDRITAKTLALHHIFGRVSPILKEEELDTLNYRKLLEIYNSVNNDSDDLFNSLIKYNKFVKKELILIRKKLDKIIQY